MYKEFFLEHQLLLLVSQIRRKEAARAEATITRDPLKEKKLEMLGRLPEFCRILRVYPLSSNGHNSRL